MRGGRDGTAIHVRSYGTANRALPVFARVMQVDLDLFKSAIAHAPRHMTWLVTARGKPRSDNAFSIWFSEAARKAGAMGKSAHGLRKACAMVLAEVGGTAHRIAAWTGHESLSEVQRYNKSADRKRILSGADEEQKWKPMRPRLETSHLVHDF